MSRPPSNLRRSIPALSALLVLLTTLLVAVGVLARSPRTRRRVRRRAENVWLGVEDLADRQTRRLTRRRIRLEAAARRVLVELWELCDDLPFVPDRDEVPRVARRLYSHGAFMGAAPALLDEPRWRAILAFLMPDVFAMVRESVRAGVRAPGLIPMFENNPVMAAFGVWCHRQDFDGGSVDAIEWDVYLDASRVEAWEDALEGPARQRLVDELVDSMVIAHASTTDTVQEQIGLCQWSDVRRTPKAQLGGVEPRAWLDLFGRALHLSMQDDLRGAIDQLRSEPRDEGALECRRHTFVHPWAPQRVVDLFREVAGRPRFGIVLEFKSLRPSPELRRSIVVALNRMAIEVVAVGSFSLADLQGVSSLVQVVSGQTLPGPRELLFVHFAVEIQTAADRGLLPPGTHVMFNGACLLELVPGGPGRYRVDDRVVDDLGRYARRHALSLGMYVQENDCDGAAVALLSELVRDRPDVFELGFAWGGLAAEVSLLRGVADRRGFGAQWALQRVSRRWLHRPVPS